jgi:hypothetical protein
MSIRSVMERSIECKNVSNLGLKIILYHKIQQASFSVRIRCSWSHMQLQAISPFSRAYRSWDLISIFTKYDRISRNTRNQGGGEKLDQNALVWLRVNSSEERRRSQRHGSIVFYACRTLALIRPPVIFNRSLIGRTFACHAKVHSHLNLSTNVKYAEWVLVFTSSLFVFISLEWLQAMILVGHD